MVFLYLNAFEHLLCLHLVVTVTLTVFHTIPNFNDLEKEAFGKNSEKRRKCWEPAFFPFPSMFSTLP